MNEKQTPAAWEAMQDNPRACLAHYEVLRSIAGHDAEQDATAAVLRDIIADEQAAWELVDELLTDGEGVLKEPETLDANTPAIGKYGEFRWVRILSDDRHPRALATFYLHFVDDELQGMWLAQVRRGKSPNPLDGLQGADDVYSPALVGEEQPDRLVAADPGGTAGVKGTRPTVRVRFIHSPDGDHRWQFPGMKVRSTDLAPVLVMLRRAGVQRVPLHTLRREINRKRDTNR